MNRENSQLQSLAQASLALQKYMWEPAQQALLDEVCENATKLIGAENTAILIPDGNMMRLVAAYPPTAETAKIKRFKITDEDGAGMTSFLSTCNHPIRLTYKELIAHRCNGGNPPTHLPSQVGYSLMGIPIIDDKSRVIGLLKAENKVGESGKATEEEAFDLNDEYAAQILANQLKFVFESAKIAEILTTLGEQLYNSPSETKFFRHLLGKVVECLGCDRADYIAINPVFEHLLWKTSFGPTNTPLKIERIPKKSFINRLLMDQEANRALSSFNVEEELEYYPVWDKTRSEAAALVKVNDRAIGIINAESKNIGWFGPNAIEKLKTIAQVCAPLIQTHAIDNAVTELLINTPTNESLKAEVDRILEKNP